LTAEQLLAYQQIANQNSFLLSQQQQDMQGMLEQQQELLGQQQELLGQQQDSSISQSTE
jgi:hypothetical protein